jgi:large subunit ribosomal protein L6
MSRIGKKPIPVPAGVKVAIDPAAHVIRVEGAKGKLEQRLRPEVRVAWSESEKEIVCTIDPNDAKDKQVRAYWGLTRALVAKMVQGVSAGFEKKLEVVGVGWNAKLQGMNLVLNVGYADPVVMPVPAGVKVEVAGPIITVSGPDAQAVGQFAAAARSKRKPEPYKGKGVKYVDETITRKQGKAFGS